MEKLSIFLNGKVLFEAESFQQASEFLYILNKYRIMNGIADGDATQVASKGSKTGKGKVKRSSPTGSLSEEQKALIAQFTEEGKKIGEVIAFMNPKDKHERDRIYAFSYALRKRQEKEQPTNQAQSY